MTDAGGAAFNPTVRTESGPDHPDDEPRADDRRDDENNDRVTGEDEGNGVR